MTGARAGKPARSIDAPLALSTVLFRFILIALRPDLVAGCFFRGLPSARPVAAPSMHLANGTVARMLDRLQALRDRLSKPLIVHSAYRSSERNKAIRSAKRSKHMEGAASDPAGSSSI